MPLGMSQDSIPQRAVLRAPQLPVPVPSFHDWVRWEEACRKTGYTWLGMFAWCKLPARGATASPGRYTKTGRRATDPGSDRGRRPWYRAAAVSAVHRTFQAETGTHRANCAEDPRFQRCRVRWSTFFDLQRQAPAVFCRPGCRKPSSFHRCSSWARACAMPDSTADSCSVSLGGFLTIFPT